MAAVAGSLLVESGSLRGQRFLLPLSPSSLLLGRDAACSICFPSESDADRLMGRRHAQIDVRADGVYVVDLNSANGTVIQLTDGRIQPLTGEMPMQNGMRIALGGEDGTWLGVQIMADSAMDATHDNALLPIEPMTVQMPKVPVPFAVDPVHHAPPAPFPAKQPGPSQPTQPAFAEHIAPPARPLSQAELAEDCVPPRRRLPEEPLPSIGVVPVVQDQELRRHRLLLLRQLAAIVAIVLLGCAIGLALGIRAPQDEAAMAQ